MHAISIGEFLKTAINSRQL